MKKVSKEEFYKVMNPLNVHPSILPGRYPYDTEWKLQSGGQVIGKTIGINTPGTRTNEYYLAEGRAK